MKRNFRWIYTNPYNGQVCFVEYAGLTLVRVEDVAKKNSRVLTFDELFMEQLS